MPERDDECLADALFFSEEDIGRKLTLSADNSEGTFGSFAHQSYVIVGIAGSPNYMSYERGTSTIGSGSVSSFILIPDSGFTADYYASLYVRLAGAAGQIYSDEYKDSTAAFEEPLRAFLEQRAELRYTDLRKEGEEKIRDAETKLEDGWSEYNSGLAELEDGWREYYDGKAEADRQLQDARQRISAAETELSENTQKLAATEADLSKNRKTVAGYISQIESSFASYGIDYTDYDRAKTQIEQAHAYGLIDDAAYAQLLAALDQLYSLYGQRDAIEAGLAEVEQGWYSWNYAAEQLAAAYDDYDNARKEAEERFADAYTELKDAETELADAKSELEDGQQELEDARESLADLKPADVYLLGRDTVTGYTTFESNSEIVDGISRVFPIFFFAVAALICSTTMNRMVVEQRTQIGVFKALGYSRAKITGKYLRYAGYASVIGWALGFFAGSWLFPTVIWKTYCIMYQISDTIEISYDPFLGLISLVVSLLCSLGATYLTCRGSLSEVPAELLRPKAPAKAGRLLLERAGFLWKHLGFLTKVSLRNIFRYKKRLLMMVLGVSGCTALLITGYGLSDSIKPIVDDQYREISLYDIAVSFSDPLTEKDRILFTEQAGLDPDSVLFVSQTHADVSANGAVQPSYILASDGALDRFISLHGAGGPVLYPERGQAVISIGLAEALSLKPGDYFSYPDKEGRPIELTVSDICTNYVFNYIYIHSESVKEQTGAPAEVRTAFVLSGSDDPHILGTRISDCNNVQSVSVAKDMIETVDGMMSAMDYVVLLIIVCAASLAFIVIYNLTNINIKEREREIATIKVLGFHPFETAVYVFRENIILAMAGALVGIPLGRWLHRYVMANIRINMIYFPVRISNSSIVLALILTMVFALFVSFLMVFKLNSINMADSMKSVE